MTKRNLTNILQNHILEKQSRLNPYPEIYISKRFYKALVGELNLKQMFDEGIILIMESHLRRGAVMTLIGCPIFLK